MKELEEYGKRKECNPRTVRELKEIVNKVPEEYLDKKILYYHEEEDDVKGCVGVWLDLFFDYTTLETCFSLSVSEDEVAHRTHEGGTPWYYAKHYED